MASSKKHLAGHLRNFVFGVEDSIVSTVGLVSGIAIAGLPKTEILLTGAVLIFVEAFSMEPEAFFQKGQLKSLWKKKECLQLIL